VTWSHFSTHRTSLFRTCSLVCFYHPRMRRGNVFSRVCLCVCLS